MPTQVKHLLVGTGRCGSSLLASILADSGANFGMETVKDWKRSAGAFEHPNLQKAGREFAISRKFAEIANGWWLHRKLRRLHMNKTKRALRSLFAEADYLKSMDLVWLTHTIYKLDYIPSIILIYRDFSEVAHSAYLSFSWSHKESEEYYLDVYRTALIQLRVFGGCAVGYNELMDSEETSWAKALAGLTGLDERRLLKSRDQRVSPIVRDTISSTSESSTSAIYHELVQYHGKIVPPGGHVYSEKH